MLIAVAWFTNHKIFDALIEKLCGNDGFTAKLIVINDNINHRPGGLDFQRFVSAGGSLYFAEKNIPMHNKYMVIDSDIVITGSYNYTYYAETLNDENIVRIKGYADIVQSYIKNFNSLVSKKPLVRNLKEYLSVFVPTNDIFSYSNYALKDISLQTKVQMKNLSFELPKFVEIKEIQVLHENYQDFVINQVVYDQWKSYYYIDKIEVRANLITIFFRAFVQHDCSLYAPNTRRAWIIRSSKDKSVSTECFAVRNVCLNGKKIIDEAQNKTVYDFYEVNKQKPYCEDSEKIQYIQIPQIDFLTCEICFRTDNIELLNGTIHLIEGKEYENFKTHWNAFNIQMNLNRERLV